MSKTQLLGPEHARGWAVLLDAVDDAANIIQSLEPPRLIATSKGRLRCPYCGKRVGVDDGSQTLVCVDYAVRWNPALTMPDESVSIGDAQSDFDTLCYRVACCDAPVSLPDGWEGEW